MKRIACVGLLALLCGACRQHDTSFEFGSSPPSTLGCDLYRYGATIDGKLTTWEVPFAEVQHTPDWLPGSEPPLPVSEAIQLASLDVPAYTDTPDAFQLEKVEYLHHGNHMSQGFKWIYLVTFERVYEYKGRTFQARGTITIPVLFDGRVVKGKRQP